MRRSTIIHCSLTLLAGAACSFARDKVNESPFPGVRPLPVDYVEPLFPHISDSAAEIHRKLNEKTSVTFEDRPLRDAIHFISGATGISMVIDVASIEEAGLLIDEPVNLKISNAPVRSILKLLLEDLELTFYVDDTVLRILTPGCGYLETGIFPVSDLVTEDRKSWKTLANLIQGETDGLWEKTDGTGGTVSISRATKSLIVRQAPEVLGQVQKILTFLRAAKRISEHRINPPAKREPGGMFGFDGKNKRRNKGLGGGFQGGGNFF